MERLCRHIALAIFVFLLLVPGVASSQKACYSGVVNIPAASLTPRFNTYIINNNGGFVDSDSTGYVDFHAPLSLPDGAKITKIIMDAYDNSTRDYISVNLRKSKYAAATNLVSINTTAAAAPGDQTYTQDNLDITIDNSNWTYFFDISFYNVATTSNRFYRLLVYFELFNCPPRSVVVIPLLN